MKKSRLNLVYGVVLFMVALLFFTYMNDTENIDYVDGKETLAPENYRQPSVTTRPTEVMKKHGISESHDNSEKSMRVARVLVESEFKRNCLDKLSLADRRINHGNMPMNVQVEIGNLFNTCVYEIEKELVLTEKNFNYSTDDIRCLNSVNEIRDYLFDLGIRAQRFGELPNFTEEDRAGIATSFAHVSEELIARGGSAVRNRTASCLPDLKEPYR